MTDWLLNLPVTVMAIVLLAAIYLGTWVIYTVVNRLAVGPRAHAFKSISAGMLSPLAVIFALLVGFFGAQVWNDADRANQAVNREASALRAVVLLGTALPPEVDAQVRNLVRLYIEDAVGGEWPAMAGRGATLKLAPPHLVQVLQLAFAAPEAVAIARTAPGGDELVDELAACARRVQLASQFLDDAARACARMRSRRIVRWLRLAGTAPWPHAEEFADEPPAALLAP